MDHNLCRDNLSAYLDGELPQQERAQLETHLAGCPECRAVLGQLGTVSGIFKKHAMEPVPLSLKGEVLGGRAKPAPYPWFKPVLALSAVAAGVFVVLNLSRSPEQVPLMQMSRNNAFESLQKGLSSASGRLSKNAGPEDAGSSAAGLYAESDKKAQAQPSPAAAATRGAYGQAKYARTRGFGGSSLAGGAGSGMSGVASMPSAPARARLAAYAVDSLAGLQVRDGTILRVTGTAGDCVDRMLSGSGEAGPPGGCHLNGRERTVVLDNFDANPYRGSEITVEGAAKYCSEEGRRFLCALENVSLIYPAPPNK
ncbi:MAG: zf-HC2 domain-containing protein [Elusimicrobiota bacterium]|nr:zf-HC2 domain-containing protein [Elusimicrobiota bacterium]